MSKQGYVYIMTNYTNTTVYVGVTSDLIRRVWEHKEGTYKGFTSRYHLTKLVYYELFDSIENAIIREKQLKSGSRERKNQLIANFNPKWRDLYDEITK